MMMMMIGTWRRPGGVSNHHDVGDGKSSQAGTELVPQNNCQDRHLNIHPTLNVAIGKDQFSIFVFCTINTMNATRQSIRTANHLEMERDREGYEEGSNGRWGLCCRY